MQPILLATDGSATAVAATAEAIRLARADGAPLVVVTVWDIPYTAPNAAVAMFPDFGAVPSVPHVEFARERAETVAGEAARQAVVPARSRRKANTSATRERVATEV